jgi:hypothetical protein
MDGMEEPEIAYECLQEESPARQETQIPATESRKSA